MAGIKIKRKPVKISSNMTPMQIRRKQVTINEKLRLLQLQLHELKQICQHPKVVKTFRINTRGDNPSADDNWIDWRCPDCTETWQTDLLEEQQNGTQHGT